MRKSVYEVVQRGKSAKYGEGQYSFAKTIYGPAQAGRLPKVGEKVEYSSTYPELCWSGRVVAVRCIEGRDVR